MSDFDLKTLFSRCTIMIGAQEVFIPEILKANNEFIIDALHGERSRLVCLHAGTNILPIVSIVICGLYCLVNSTKTAEETIRSLPEGKYVIYNGSRGVFLGFNEWGFAIIKQANSLINYVPPARFHLVKPYNGPAQTLNGYGVGDIPAKRRQFLSSLLEVDAGKLPTEITTSVVFVMDRKSADSIIKRVAIRDLSGQLLPISQIFPCAYYTENDIYHYAGNISKADPVIKFTGRVSVAREIIIDDEDRKISGLVVCGQAEIETGESELTSLINRRSLKHVFLYDRIGCWNAAPLLKQYDDIKLFAWTKDIIQRYSINNVGITKSPTSDIVDELSRNIELICQGDIQREVLPGPINPDTYMLIKKALWRISKFDYSDEEKELFVITGYTLLRLFTYSFFSMHHYEKAISSGDLASQAPRIQIERLRQFADEFEGNLKSDMEIVASGLTSLYDDLYYTNLKFDYLFNMLVELPEGKTVTIVTPKEAYGRAFESIFDGKNKRILKRVNFTTPGRYDNNSSSEKVVAVGAITGKKYNPCDMITAGKSLMVMYDFEESVYSAVSNNSSEIMHYYDTRNVIQCELLSNLKEQTVEKDSFIDFDLEDYIKNITLTHAVESIVNSSVGPQNLTSVFKVIMFETGETAFLSRNYTAYSLITSEEIIIEKEASEIQSGDYLVFMSHDDERKDIVDEFLKQLIEKDRSETSLSNSYDKSKRWKALLKNHMDSKGLTFKDVSNEMAVMGHKKHEVTIRSWLNEESHIVGPRDVDSYISIALISGDKDMQENPEAYWDACNIVRSARMRILNYIGLAIVNSLENKTVV